MQLEGQNPEFNILEGQNLEFNILEGQNPEFKILQCVQTTTCYVILSIYRTTRITPCSQYVNNIFMCYNYFTTHIEALPRQ